MAATKWEYKFQGLDFEPDSPGSIEMFLRDLNQLGQAGWEVVLYFTKTKGDYKYPIILLKRPQSN